MLDGGGDFLMMFSDLGTVGVSPPSGFVFIVDDIDGAYIVDADGYYLIEAA